MNNRYKMYNDNVRKCSLKSHYTHWNAVIRYWTIRNRKTQKRDIFSSIEMKMNQNSVGVLKMIEGVSFRIECKKLKWQSITLYTSTGSLRSISYISVQCNKFI